MVWIVGTCVFSNVTWLDSPTINIRLLPVSYTHLRAHETRHDLVCRLLLEKIESTVASLDNANIVERSNNYIRAEFKSRFMGYVDDVEFLYDEFEGVSHVRSASRVGFSDLGVNRRRVEKIRSLVE